MKRSIKILMVILAFLLLPVHAFSVESIVDNDAAGFSTTGSWYSSTLVPGYYGSNYRWAYGGSGEASAQWVFQLPSDGYYQVFAWWSAPYTTRSPDAPYTIYHDGGSTTVLADQRSNGSRWNDLGVYYFMSGEARIILSNDAANNPVADAVRMVEIESPVANFEATPLYGEAPLAVSFENQSSGYIGSFLWDFGTGKAAWKKIRFIFTFLQGAIR